jgi:ribosomal protein L7Ae-like RNA K-turn-binding protein
VVLGTQQVRESVRAGRVRHVLVADDLTATGMDKLVPMLEAREVSYALGYSRAVLGEAVGRGPLAAVGITDAGFARRLRTLMAADGDGG